METRSPLEHLALPQDPETWRGIVGELKARWGAGGASHFQHIAPHLVQRLYDPNPAVAAAGRDHLVLYLALLHRFPEYRAGEASSTTLSKMKEGYFPDVPSMGPHVASYVRESARRLLEKA